MQEITVWGASSGLASFGFSQEDADLYMDVGLNGLCVPYTLQKAVPLVLPVAKSASWEQGDPDETFYQAWLADPALHLPLGYWKANVDVEFVGSPGGYCRWESGYIPSEKEPVHLSDERAIRMTPLVPLPMPPEGCIDDFAQPYAQPPESLLVGGDTNLRLTMFSGWGWRDSAGGGDADYGVYEVDLPPKPIERAPGGSIGITIGPGFQLIDATAALYAADHYITDRHGVVSTGEALDQPVVAFGDDGTLEVVVPDRVGSWVISVRVNWLTPCLIGDGEVNFGVETR
jgi:hypothetical protein